MRIRNAAVNMSPDRQKSRHLSDPDRVMELTA